MKKIKQVIMDQKGLSLVELLATVVVSAILFVGTMQVLNTVMSITRKQRLEAECQQTANILVAQLTSLLKSNQVVTIEDNNTSKVSLVYAVNGRKTVALKDTSSRIQIDQTVINPRNLVVVAEGIDRRNYRENSTDLTVINLEFFDKDNQSVYKRRVDLTTYKENTGKGWW